MIFATKRADDIRAMAREMAEWAATQPRPLELGTVREECLIRWPWMTVDEAIVIAFFSAAPEKILQSIVTPNDRRQ